MIQKNSSNTRDDFNLKIISSKTTSKSNNNIEFQTIKKIDNITTTGTPKENSHSMEISAIVRDTARIKVKMTSPLSRTLTVTRMT